MPDHPLGPLPRPGRERWQPLRGGLLNLYLFDDLEFPFADGRLLLRGNNGTGKSRILALQLPFLLDGRMIPSRVEPDGDSAKRVEWHLVMNGRYEERVGYSWLEFGRIGADGQEEFFTIGIGLRAVHRQSGVGSWFFTTRQRIREDLELVDSQGAPRVQRGLAEAIGSKGQVFKTSSEYRIEIDRALFGLGSARYESLLNLLIELRHPQLSRTLDEKRISKALSDALPPPEERVLSDIHDAYQHLERDRAELESCRRAEQGTRAFAKDHASYLRVEARRRTEKLRGANSRFEELGRERAELDRQTQQATREFEEHTRTIERIDTRVDALDGEIQGLEQSQAMQQAAVLDQLGKRRDEKQRDSERAQAELERAQTNAADRKREHREAIDAAREARREREQSEVQLRNRSAEALLEATVSSALISQPRSLEHADTGALETAEASSDPDPDQLDGDRVATRRTLDKAIETRGTELDHIERLEASVASRVGEESQARARSEDAQARMDEAAERLADAHETRVIASERLGEAYTQWRSSLVQIEPPELADLESDLDTFALAGVGLSPTSAAATDALDRVLQSVTKTRTQREHEAEQTRGDLEIWNEECRRLESGDGVVPATAPGRNRDSRENRPGAELWRLCEFRDELDEEMQAGIEAALEASGLLDAWVSPTGEAALEMATEAAIDSDAFLVPWQPREKDSLADVLLAAHPPGEARAGDTSLLRIDGVLRSVGLGPCDRDVWVDIDGSYSLGPMRGQHTKETAQYIGHAARERERWRLLSEAREQVAQLDLQATRIAFALRALDERETHARAECAAVPSGEELRSAAVHVASAEREWGRERTEHERRNEAHTRIRLALGEARDALATAADELGLREALGRIAVLKQSLEGLRGDVQAFDSRTQSFVASLRMLAAAYERLASATNQRDNSEKHAREIGREWDRLKQEFESLERSFGSSVRQVREQLEKARNARRAATVSRDGEQSKQGGCREKLGDLSGQLHQLKPRIEEHGKTRESAADRLRELCATGLLAGAHPDFEPWADAISWSTTRSVTAARQIADKLRAVDHGDSAIERARDQLHRRFTELQTALGDHYVTPRLEERAGATVMTASLGGMDRGTFELADHFVGEVNHRERLFQEREREVIENHLIDQMAAHLHERLRDGAELVSAMNAEVEARPMSTGMKLRFKWEADPELGDAGQRVRRLLDTSPSLWRPEQRYEVADFLRDRIEQARNDAPELPPSEQLEQGLDYRLWHRFAIERYQDGRWVRLTRRTHGTGSGGEKAIALTVPQLAAASAHYLSARSDAPRLILLDEAFVGVDGDMRKKCMSLLVAFDLDVVMTSEREWGTYDTVPALSICQLATLPGIDAIHTTRWTWNGTNLEREGVSQSQNKSQSESSTTS